MPLCKNLHLRPLSHYFPYPALFYRSSKIRFYDEIIHFDKNIIMFELASYRERRLVNFFLIS